MAWHPGPLTPSSMGGGSCRPQPRLACCKPKCWSQPPHSCSSSQSWGGQLRGPLSGAARDLTSFTLWLIGHRWGPESDENPAAPKVPCSPPSLPQPQAFRPGQEGPGEAGPGAESRVPFLLSGSPLPQQLWWVGMGGPWILLCITVFWCWDYGAGGPARRLLVAMGTVGLGGGSTL